MQELNNDVLRQGKWQTDESDLVNALMEVMWQHHVNRKARIRNFFRRFMRRPHRSG